VTKVEVYGEIVNGSLSITNERRLSEDLKQFKDCEVVVIIKKRGRRSTQSNRYYFGVIIAEIRAEFRNRGIEATQEEMHEALKLKFNPIKTLDENTGELLLEIGGRTSEFNQDEMSEYIEKIMQWSAESLGIYIPPPNTQVDMFNANSLLHTPI
jgi:hypothetical protein